MKQVPFHDNPGNACALACYTMAAQYLLPDKGLTFEKLAELAEWRKGYCVWGFKLWKWLMDQAIHIVDYDVIDYEAWASEGTAGLKRTSPPKEFKFYEECTYDLEAESKQVNLMYNHPNFHYVHRKPTWDDVVSEFNKPGICDLVLNSRALDKKEGFSLHRVVLLDITDSEVVFHDPRADGKYPARREPHAHFRQVFESVDGPELARYYIS